MTAGMQQLFAQSVKFGIKAGLNESTAQSENGTSVSDIAGFNAAIFADIQWSKISIEPGLSYTSKGYHSHSVIVRSTPTPYTFDAEGNVTLNYLELPVNVLYHIPVGPLKIFFGGGPYLGIAMSGSSQGNTTVDGVKTVGATNKLSFGPEDEFKKTDYGFNALVGFTLQNGLLFSVDYGHGFTNTVNRNGLSIKNRVLSLSIGYEFL